MPGTKEIKTRIESVGETRKITNAMYLIASTKLQRARQELDQTRPYFEALRGEIRRIFQTAYDVDSHYFYPVGDDTPLKGTYGCLLITADKGLAGAYTQNAIREAQQLLENFFEAKRGLSASTGFRILQTTVGMAMISTPDLTTSWHPSRIRRSTIPSHSTVLFYPKI